MKRKPLNRPRYTAYHEAGHAVIGRVLGLACGPATIVPDAVGYGCTTIKSPRATLDEWHARGRSRFNGTDLRSIYRAYIIELMAGREAAELCCGDGGEFVGNSGDIRQIEYLIRCYDLDLSFFGIRRPDGDLKRLDRLRKATRHLCMRHRDKIARVAAALLKDGKVSSAEIDRLVGPL